MAKILFIDIDDVFVLDKCDVLAEDHPHYANFGYMYTHDPFAAAFISKLFEKNDDLYGVLHSTWRTEDEAWLKKHFEIQNTFVRWHDDFKTSLDLKRYPSIQDWVDRHSLKRDDWAIIDDEKPPLPMKSRTVRIDGNYGFGIKNVNRLKHLLQLKT